MMNYNNIDSCDWSDILSDDLGGHCRPMTVHLPIHSPHSSEFVHVEPSFNVCRRRVYPGLRNGDSETYDIRSGIEVMNVQFAFDDPPFIPNSNLTDVKLADGGIPIPTLSHFAYDLLYSIEYFTRRIDANQSVLIMNISVCNKDIVGRKGHVWIKPLFQREIDLFDYHYIAYYWDNSKWLKHRKWPYTKIIWVNADKLVLSGGNLDEEQIVRSADQVGRIVSGGFDVEFVRSIQYKDESYNLRFDSGKPYFVEERFRLKEAENLIHFSTDLSPDEVKTFSVALLVNEQKTGPEYADFLNNLDPAEQRTVCQKEYKALTSNTAKLMSNAGDRGAIFNECQIVIEQLLVDFGDNNGFTPTQGGTSERFFIWVWEAVIMLRPMLRLGHFESVKQAIINIFSLQDAGCPPHGNFTTTEGSIGTTGPRWANSTGSALQLAAEYCLYSKDRDFQDSYLPKIIKAMKWIIGEISATRCLDEKGRRVKGWGVMPKARATDGDNGYVVSFTDAYSYAGVKVAVELLESINHPDAIDYRQELELYREAIETAIEQMTAEDGFIERHLSIGEQKIFAKFRGSGGGIMFCENELLDVNSKIFSRYVEYCENNIAKEGLYFPMDQDVFYTVFFEHMWHKAYLRRGEWKKAFLAAAVTLKYAVSPGGLQVNERFHRKNPAYTPWQPNGSGSGRILDMLMREVYFEDGQTAVIAGGMPWQILRRNKVTTLEKLFTPRGTVSIRIEMIENNQAVITLEGSLPSKIRIPNFLKVVKIGSGLEKDGDKEFSITAGNRRTQLTITSNN